MSGLLEIRDLDIVYPGVRRGITVTAPFKAVKAASLSVREGTTHSLVGESGSGKSTIARAVTGLLPVNAGTIVFDGKSLVGSKRDKSTYRDIQMVFQDPRSSLNPRLSLASIISDAWQAHPQVGPSLADKKARIAELLSQVGVDPDLMDRRPSQLSGGQCQRVSIARALALKPRLLICDEAVSALDVSVQAQILQLLQKLQSELGLTMLFISHDLGVVRQISHDISVMYHGDIVEAGPVEDIFSNPQQDYTRMLLDAALDIAEAE